MQKIKTNNRSFEVSGFFQKIIDNLSVGGIFVNKDRTIKYCNPITEDIFGYSKNEVVGKQTDMLYGDRRKDKTDKNEIKNRLSDYGYHVGSAQGTRKDGSNVPLDLLTFIIKEDEGAAIIIKEASKKPSEIDIDASALLQDLMDSIPDIIYFKDIKNRFVMVNKAHAAALKLTPEEVVGHTDLDFFPPSLAEKYFSDDNAILETGEAIIDKIERAPRSDGSITYVSTTKVPRYDKDGNIIGTIGITRDVTDRMIAEEELRRYKDHLEELVAERTRDLEVSQEKLRRMYNIKSDFVSMVSHELRTPIATIKANVDIVLDGTTGDLNKEQKSFLQAALNNIERLSRLINDVLDFSKLENKKIEYRLIDGNLNEVIEQVLKSYEPVLEKKGLNLYKGLDPFLPLARFDPDRITQVLYNLITNAVKFTEKGFIKVESYRDQDKVRVIIEDSGEGIEEKDIARIFEKFEQINKPGGPRNKGTGLGLAICKQIVEQLGGIIWVESRYGKGSKFIFTLPSSSEGIVGK